MTTPRARPRLPDGDLNFPARKLRHATSTAGKPFLPWPTSTPPGSANVDLATQIRAANGETVQFPHLADSAAQHNDTTAPGGRRVFRSTYAPTSQQQQQQQHVNNGFDAAAAYSLNLTFDSIDDVMDYKQDLQHEQAIEYSGFAQDMFDVQAEVDSDGTSAYEGYFLRPRHDNHHHQQQHLNPQHPSTHLDGHLQLPPHPEPPRVVPAASATQTQVHGTSRLRHPVVRPPSPQLSGSHARMPAADTSQSSQFQLPEPEFLRLHAATRPLSHPPMPVVVPDTGGSSSSSGSAQRNHPAAFPFTHNNGFPVGPPFGLHAYTEGGAATEGVASAAAGSAAGSSNMAGSSAGGIARLTCLWAKCKASIADHDALILHVCKTHIDGRNRGHRCLWLNCGIDFESSRQLEEHVLKHVDRRPDCLPCQWDGCSSRFANFDGLTSHVSEMHVGTGLAIYQCRWRDCARRDSTFTQRQKLMRHIQTHTGDKPVVCTVCHKRFSEPSVMVQHMRTHTGERPYPCLFPGCGRRFTIIGALTIHSRIHTGEKPFECTFCDRAFPESSNLAKHLRTHTGERPFPCPVLGCGKFFTRSDQASRHARTHERPVNGNVLPPLTPSVGLAYPIQTRGAAAAAAAGPANSGQW